MPVWVRWSASAISDPEELYAENACSCKLRLPSPLPSLLGRAGISRAFPRLITFSSFYKASNGIQRMG